MLASGCVYKLLRKEVEAVLSVKSRLVSVRARYVHTHTHTPFFLGIQHQSRARGEIVSLQQVT